jgi:putative phosphoribosyl transferase
LEGDLRLPAGARGLVVFAHGSGSGRASPRNVFVANVLGDAGLGTLLFDLLTPEEERVDERTRHLRFDIELLGERLVHALDWASGEPRVEGLSLGCFGSSTGAAAALVAASTRPAVVEAVVSRGGRPDLAGDALDGVRCPTLLLVGGRDTEVLRLNQVAYDALTGERALRVIEGATHLFEEPGALEIVARQAAGWFTRHLAPPTPPVPPEPPGPV